MNTEVMRDVCTKALAVSESLNAMETALGKLEPPEVRALLLESTVTARVAMRNLAAGLERLIELRGER